MKTFLALVSLAGLLTVGWLEFIELLQPDEAPARQPKTEHELQPAIGHCFELEDKAFADCVLSRTERNLHE